MLSSNKDNVTLKLTDVEFHTAINKICTIFKYEGSKLQTLFKTWLVLLIEQLWRIQLTTVSIRFRKSSSEFVHSD